MTATALMILGYLGFGLNVIGNVLIAHKRRVGWGVRMLCNIAWLFYAVRVTSGEGLPVFINHAVFLLVNTYGLYTWRVK